MQRDPQGAGRSAVLRRHRHLCARLRRDRRRGRRPRQRCDPRHRRQICAQGDRRRRQSRHDAARPRSRRRCAACGSTPTPSTIRPASTPPTSRSTSRSRSRSRCATAGSTRRARNALLAEMTDEVAALVLRNNYLQTLAISLAERRGLEDLGFQQRLMQIAGAARPARPRGRVPARRRWSSPSAAAARSALTRPELAVLLAYAKLALYDDLLETHGAGRSLSRPRAAALFPARARRALSRRARAAPAAARDHRHGARQLDDQSRRAVARSCAWPTRPARRPPASPTRSPRCATATA